MKKTLIGLSLLTTSVFAQATTSPDATPSNFKSYIEQYLYPELFFKNDTALDARINLLRHVPKGGVAKIMSFEVISGAAFLFLEQEMCAAAERGVKVEFSADSHSGDRFNTIDVHEQKDTVNKDGLPIPYIENGYKQLATCGVKVRIFNHVDDSNFAVGRFLGSVPSVTARENIRALLPFIGLDWAIASEYEGNMKVVRAALKSHIAKNEILAKLNPADSEMFTDVIWSIAKVMGKIKFLNVEQMTEADFIAFQNEAQSDFQNSFGKLKTNAAVRDAMTQLKKNPDSLRRLVLGTISELRKTDSFENFYKAFRVFNRLNHRKLFWVAESEKPDAKGCAILGGRNIGDHYLREDDNNFLDADLLTCTHHEDAAGFLAHSEEKKSLFRQAEKSFDSIFKSSGVDSELQKFLKSAEAKKALITEYPIPEKPVFSEGLKFLYSQKMQDPTLETFTFGKAVSEGHSIKGGKNFQFLTATWDRDSDQIQTLFIKAIELEQLGVFIETPYFEANPEYRAAIGAALARGVQVHVKTNGFFTADGPSKAIRLAMNKWVTDLQGIYGDKFLVEFTTPAKGGKGGHMTHAKLASFACQLDETKSAYALNLIGSHNFHQRSGYSDQEHAISWQAPISADCQSALRKLSKAKSIKAYVAKESEVSPSLKDLRLAFYQNPNNKGTAKVYSSLAEEFVSELCENKGKMPSWTRLPNSFRSITELLLTSLYDVDVNEVDCNNSNQVKNAGEIDESVSDLVDLLQSSGILDVIGIVM